MTGASSNRSGTRRPRSVARSLSLLACSLVLGGCAFVAELPYFWQAAAGQLELLQRSRPVESVLSDEGADARLKSRLALARDIRRFAMHELGLPDNGSYTRYADLARPFVVWNVFAAPPWSLRLKEWCFPVAGCVSYRGYFDQARAQDHAARLREAGWETYVAGVPAFSTLGWFDDPLLNTFVFYPEAELARLVFHELAHQVVYLKGDSAFNESFATAVEEAGVERWLATQPDPAIRERYQVFAQRRRDFVGLLRRHRAALEALYAQDLPAEQRPQAKARAFEALRQDYAALKLSWGGFSGYDRWFAQPLGNAHLASVATYHQYVPGFRRLLEEQGGDLRRFYARAAEVARLAPGERARLLGEAIPDALGDRRYDR